MMSFFILILMTFFASVFAFCQTDDYKPFWGNLHSHTSYSDGQGIPSEAYEYAKNTAGLDFLAVTDHSEQMTPFFPLPPYFRWLRLQAQADDANEDGVFIAIAGYEYGNVTAGHLNVFGTDKLIWYPNSFFLWNFYETLLETPDAVAQFNHPYGDEYFNNWYDFYYPGISVDRKISLIETDSFHENFEKGYIRALERGWHVAPVANQDNHDPDWGTKDSRRTGVWVKTLTRENILQCLRDRRCFSTTDSNAWIKLTGNGKWMGWATTKSPVSLTITVEDDPSDPWDRIELISEGGVVVATEYPDSSTFTWEIVENPTENTYWYAKAYEQDGQVLFSAPLWYIKR